MPVFLFTDIEGSTKLWEAHTAQMGDVISRHDAILQELTQAWGGWITKHTGDGVTVAFEKGEPLSCAIDIQKRFAGEPWGAIGELRVRVGLHAGEAEKRGDDYFGPVVNCAARIMAAAWGGQILLTPSVTAICELPRRCALLDLGEHFLKDVSTPQHVFQMVHPDLPWQEFPPLRTLSGTAIRQSIGEQAGRFASLPPPEMAIGLVSAALLPTVLGEQPADSPTLEGNLSVLGELGAGSLRQFLAHFARGLQIEQQAGRHPSAVEIRQQLEQKLMEQWEAGGEVSAVLRSDVSQLLQAVEAVDHALGAATGEARGALAQTIAHLGGSFREFRWMVDGLQEALTEVQIRQAMQFALQQEQLALQRQQLDQTGQLMEMVADRDQPSRAADDVPPLPAGRSALDKESAATVLVNRLRQPDAGTLDLPSLTALYASRHEVDIGSREAQILVRSALQHAVDARPWLKRVGSPALAVQALRSSLEHYAEPQIRGRIVEALDSVEGSEATEALLDIALTEDFPEVRARAAVAAGRRGRLTETVQGLIGGLGGSNQTAALAAFVAVADELGIPPNVGPYPRANIFFALVWRRWEAARQAIGRQVLRAALSGLLVGVLGSSTPFFSYLAAPEYYQQVLQGLVTLPSWMFSGALMFLLIGCLQGAASGFALGLADAIWRDMGHRTWRWALGVSSGLALTILLTAFSFAGVTSPEAGPLVFIPVYLLSGVANGAAATLVIPRLGTSAPLGSLLKRAAAAIPMTAASAVPYAFLLFRSSAGPTLAHRLLFSVGFPVALAVVFGRRKGHIV
jgi:class 3 adenylate cyclase